MLTMCDCYRCTCLSMFSTLFYVAGLFGLCACSVTELEHGMYRLKSHKESGITDSKISTQTIGSGSAGLYCIDNENNLGKYDLTTGNFSELARASGIPINAATSENLGCLDEINGIYYMVYQQPLNYSYTGLYPYNIIDPSSKYDTIKLTMIYANDVIGANDICITDPSTGVAYFWGKDKNTDSIQRLIKISYINNTNRSRNNFDITSIGNYSDINKRQDGDPGSIAAYDSKRDYLWMSGYNSDRNFALFYINTINGELKNSVEIDYYAYVSLSYDRNLDSIIAIGINRSGNSYFDITMYYLDAVTLNVTKTFDAVNNNYCGVIGIWDEDVKNGIYYQFTIKDTTSTTGNCSNFEFYDGYVSSFDVKTGQVNNEILVCPGLKECPWDIEYYNPNAM